MHLPLPPHLSDSVVRSGSCLTLAMWKIHGSLGLCSLHSLHRALLGCRSSSSYLAHAPFFPMSVGLANDPTMPLHYFCYDITPLLFHCYPWCNVPVSQKKKKKVMVRFFGTTRAPPNTLTPTTHLTHWLLSFWPAIPLFLFSFLSFLFSHTVLSITCSSSPTGTSIPPSPPSFFWQCHWKILRNL